MNEKHAIYIRHVDLALGVKYNVMANFTQNIVSDHEPYQKLKV